MAYGQSSHPFWRIHNEVPLGTFSDAGCWMLMLDAGCWMLEAGCEMRDAGRSADNFAEIRQYVGLPCSWSETEYYWDVGCEM